MPFTAGTRIGPYEIVAPLGAGGMGEVYRARDTTLGREVALKVLPDVFAADTDRLARFRREAQVLASLNHPHIAQIYGLEDRGDVRALVMELVEGPTLADRIAIGPIALDEALAVAMQIAEALETAHGQGIVHRDLKPANIKVRADGSVKVLDFGLAKALDPAAVSTVNATMSPTLSIHATQAGIILGTAAYMSPEQARGKTVDTRADIWAFGVVFFEMLAGRRPFDGEEISDTLAGILKSEPAWPLLPAETPPSIHRLLRRCLQKDGRQRLQHIGDARLEIEDAQRGAPADATATNAPPIGVRRRERLLWGTAVVLAALAAAAAMGWRTAGVPDAPEMRLEIATPGALASQFALSPDGRTIVYTAAGPRGRQLWLRSLDATSPSALAGTEGGEYPFWSPDGRSLGFFANNKLKRLDIDGGQPQSLANVFTPAGGTWNSDGTILYVPNDSGGVFRVSAKGGDSSEATPQRSPRLATRSPQFLPDGRRFLFYVARGGEPAGVYIGELGHDTIRRILGADGPALYGSGYLWFVRENTLFAQMFDDSTRNVIGPVHHVADKVGIGLVAANVSTSFNGPIAYRTGTGQARRDLTWFDRSGKALGTVGDEGALVSNPSMSRDGRFVVVQRTVQQNIDLWLLDLQRNVFTRLTDQPGIDSMPVWAPDGNRVVFSEPAADNTTLAVMRIDRAASKVALGLPSGANVRIATDWSPDGRFLLSKEFDELNGSADVWALPMEGDRTPVRVVATSYDERDGQFSPDGKWIAYESDESGRPEIYMQPFPGPGPKVRVSIDGGTQVRWRRDGKEVFYIALDESLMAVTIEAGAGAAHVGTPVPLFKTRIAPIRAISRQQYVVAPDGLRFLIVTSDQPPLLPVTVILNWNGAREAGRAIR